VTSPNRAPSTNFAIFVFLFALGMLIHKTQLWEAVKAQSCLGIEYYT